MVIEWGSESEWVSKTKFQLLAFLKKLHIQLSRNFSGTIFRIRSTITIPYNWFLLHNMFIGWFLKVTFLVVGTEITLILTLTVLLYCLIPCTVHIMSLILSFFVSNFYNKEQGINLQYSSSILYRWKLTLQSMHAICNCNPTMVYTRHVLTTLW